MLHEDGVKSDPKEIAKASGMIQINIEMVFFILNMTLFQQVSQNVLLLQLPNVQAAHHTRSRQKKVQDNIYFFSWTLIECQMEVSETFKFALFDHYLCLIMFYRE